MKSFFTKIALYINAALIVLLLISYTSIFVNPDWFWVPAFIGLAYPALLLLNIFFAIYWILRFKLYFLYSIIAVLIGWNYMSEFIQIKFNTNTKDAETASSIKIISYNVRLFNLYDWADNKNANTEIIDFIKSENPDLIFLQEFATKTEENFSEKIINDKLHTTPYRHIVQTFKNQSYSYGIATYSKYPIINKGTIKYDNTANVTIYSDLLINNDTIRVFNNHLQSIRFDYNNYRFIANSKSYTDEARLKEIKDISFRLKDAFIKRARQAEILHNHIEQSPYPVIVCGDFNDTPVSYTYQKIQGNLKDAFITSGKGFGNTYIGRFPSYRIDFILYSPVFYSVSYNSPRVKLSDHYPVCARLILER